MTEAPLLVRPDALKAFTIAVLDRWGTPRAIAERTADLMIRTDLSLASQPPVQLFLRGLVIGFSIAAPVGPIGVLCIRRTLADGRAAGFVSGLGAATADAVYGAVAAFGLTVVSGVLIGQSLWLRLGGGVFLCYLGVKTFLAEPAAEAAPVRGAGLLGAYASTFALTLTNPTTILSFVAIFAGFGAAAGTEGWASASTLVAGVFLGSALWWLLLSGGVGLAQRRLEPRALRWINRGAGIVIAAFGALALLSAVSRP